MNLNLLFTGHRLIKKLHQTRAKIRCDALVTILPFPLSLLQKCQYEIEETAPYRTKSKKKKKRQQLIVIFYTNQRKDEYLLKEYLCHVAQMTALSLKKTGDFTELRLIN